MIDDVLMGDVVLLMTSLVTSSHAWLLMLPMFMLVANTDVDVIYDMNDVMLGDMTSDVCCVTSSRSHMKMDDMTSYVMTLMTSSRDMTYYIG